MRLARDDRALLGAAGVGILLTQHVAVREIGSTFFSTELVLLGATVITLAGPSLAYAFAHRISAPVLAAWGGLSLAAHLALPVGLRALVGAMAARGGEGISIGIVVAAGVILLSGFHAVFLPRCAAASESSTGDPGRKSDYKETGLARLYAAELGGALVALVFIAASPSYRVTLAAYWAAAAAVIHLGVGRRAASIAAAAAVVAAVIAYPALDRWAAGVYFAGYHGRRQPVIVETAHSAYQRIDVVDDARGRRGLYLDGVPFHVRRPGGFDPFNTFLAGVPGALRAGGAGGAGGPGLASAAGEPAAALVIGSGSFSSAAALRRLGYDVTVVELDPEVARIGFARFQGAHGLAPGEVRVAIDDGRRYLARTAATFDVIALDVPAPYHVRTALLHTPRFYRLVASRLRPGGVVALSLCGAAFGDTARAIGAAAAEVFPTLVAVEPGSSGIALLYAGAPLPFSAEQVVAALAQDPAGGLVFGDAEVRAAVAGAAPLSEERLAPVLALARSELEDSFRGR